MIDYLGDLGGLIDIIYIIGGLLTLFLTRNALQAALITDSYQIQKYNHDESEYYATRGGTENNLLTENSESRSEDDDDENANGGS